MEEKPIDLNPYRSAVLEEVAQAIEKLIALGDTAASFAAFVRNMKND
jgi:hypothetical protein